jgi:hypothetical protein
LYGILRKTIAKPPTFTVLSFLQNAVEKDAAPHHSLFSSVFLLPVHRERVPD